ncbi:MAG: DUF4430 domain-containing protein [Patescibacteria group bacterium]
MKRNYITIGILIMLVAAIFAVSRTGYTEPGGAAATPLVATTTEPAQTAPRHAPASISQTSAAPSPANNVTFKAGDRIYGTYIASNESVLALMRSLASTTDFKFTGKEYPSLGFFVESINGKKNGDGAYWILYINGKSSDLGASNATIHAGDTVEWRYEKSY